MINFSQSNSEIKAKCLIKKTELLCIQGKFKAAENTISRYNYLSISDSFAFLGRYTNAFTAYLSGNFENAENQIIQLKSKLPKFYSNNIKILEILILNEERKWDLAKNVAASLELDSTERYKIDSLYSENLIPKMKSPTKAEKLSTFLPGSGFLYAGNIGEGIVNISFQLIGLGATTFLILNKYYFTGLAIGYVSTFQRFYTGGIKRSSFLVEKRNYEKSKEFNEKLKIELIAIVLK